MKVKRSFKPRKEARASRISRSYIAAAAILGFLALMFLIFSCTKMPTTGSVLSEDQQEHDEDVFWPAPAGRLNVSILGSAKDAGWIGPDGGVLNADRSNLALDFQVPPGALNEQVYISMTAVLFHYGLAGKFQKGLNLIFQPDGLVFSEPAEIEFKAKLLDANKGDVLKLYWYNPETKSWEIERRIKVKDAEAELEFKIYHFSRYAIG